MSRRTFYFDACRVIFCYLPALLDELFIITGIQRDHYQHLDKLLKFDLNKDRRDMVAVNELLALDIKFHLLTTIKLDLDKIRTFIRRDMAWFVRDLNALALKLSMTTSEQVHLKFQPRGVQFG